MRIIAKPIVPPDGDRCWAVHLVNDEPEVLESVVVESVDYEWGGSATTESPNLSLGPIPSGSTLEIWRETNTEVRTAVTLVVVNANGRRRFRAELGKLYRRTSGEIVAELELE